MAIPAIGLSFGASVAVLFGVYLAGPVRVDLYTLIELGDLVVSIGLYADALSTLLLLLVTGVSFLVHVFSSRYMQGDPRYRRFFATTSLFTFAMVMLVMSTNLGGLYFFWEIMGICSYLLISHGRERWEAARSATRVFLVNGVADIGLGLAVFLTFATFGTLDIQEVLKQAPHQTEGMLTMIAMLFWIAAMGKSAQFPLHIWLPHAMEAPTPVSALIHAATMVNAGIFLVIRLSPLFILAPAAMTVALFVGGLTALLAATAALTQNDIKKILAYSTMSQLGLMIMACGAGAFIAAAFHMLAHGAVKAYLFLASGSALKDLSHRSGHDQGLPRASILAAALLLALMPPLLIVFSSYGELWSVDLREAPSFLFFGVALATAFLTGRYLSRGISVLEGAEIRPRLGAVVAVSGLATVFSAFAGFLGPSVGRHPVQGEIPTPDRVLLLVLGLLAAAGGWTFVYARMTRPAHSETGWREIQTRLYVLAHNKWYLDEIYDSLIVRPNLRFAQWLWKRVDLGIIEKTITGSADRTIQFARWLWLSVDIRGLSRAVDGLGQLTFYIARWLWKSVDIRLLGGLVDGTARSTVRTARWLWKWADIRGLERLLGGVGRQNEAASEILREVEPSMLQHQLLVTIFFLILTMIIFLVFVL